MYTEGVMVVGLTEIEGKKPYEKAKIKEGDVIIRINEKEIHKANELIECVNSSRGRTLEVIYIRDGKEAETSILPVKTSTNEYKLGLWVRDGAARNWNSHIL